MNPDYAELLKDMPYAIGCKKVRFKAMTYTQFRELIYNEKHEKPGPDTDGYLVAYVDQNPPYISFSPKEVFEKFYYPIASKDGSKLEPQDIENMLVVEDVRTMDDGRTTLVKTTTLSGFTGYNTSTCVDKKNYSQKIGAEIVVENEQNALWKYMGFILQWATSGLKDKA